MEEEAKYCSSCLKINYACSGITIEVSSEGGHPVNEEAPKSDSLVTDIDVSLSCILVKNFHGKEISVEISPRTNVYQLLQEVEVSSGIKFDKKAFFKGDKVLILTNNALKHFQDVLVQPILYYENCIWSSEKLAESILNINPKELKLKLDEYRSIFASLPFDNLKSAVVSDNILDYFSVVTSCIFTECTLFTPFEISTELTSKIQLLNCTFIFSKALISRDLSTLPSHAVIFALNEDFWIEHQEQLVNSGSIVIIRSTSILFNEWTRITNITCSKLVYYVVIRNIQMENFNTREFFDQLRRLIKAMSIKHDQVVTKFNEKALEILKLKKEINLKEITEFKNEFIERFNSYYSGINTNFNLLQEFTHFVLVIILENSLISINSFEDNEKNFDFLINRVTLIDIATLLISCLYNQEIFNIRLNIFSTVTNYEDIMKNRLLSKERLLRSRLSKKLIEDFKINLSILIENSRVLEALKILDGSSDIDKGHELEILHSLVPVNVILMPDFLKFAGLTIYGGIITLQSSTYHLQNASVFGRAKIFYTLRHEIAHKKWLRYGSGNRFTKESPEVIIGGQSTNESGVFLDSKIYGSIPVKRSPSFLESMGETIAKKIINCEELTQEEISIAFRQSDKIKTGKQSGLSYTYSKSRLKCKLKTY